MVKYDKINSYGNLREYHKFDIKKWRKNNAHLFVNDPMVEQSTTIITPEQELADLKNQLGGRSLTELLQL